jgi:hypothetical protein
VVTLNLTINSTTFGTDVVTACGSYTWIDGVTYSTSNNTATDTLINASGCDSVVTLNLTLTSINISTSLSNQTITATQTAAAYQWLNCDSAFAVISTAIGQNFTTTNSGSYAVELTLNGCVDTSNCVAVTILTASFMEDGNQVRLYPNPTSSDVTIDFDRQQKSIRLRLFDSIGRLIQSKNYQDIRDIRLRMPLFSGVYMVELNSENGRAVFQVIKE